MASTISTRDRPSDEAIRDRLVDAFRTRKGEATKADLVAATGLPLERVDVELPAVSDEYGARLRVTESGELLYSFPAGLRSRYRGFGPSLRRFWKGFKKGAIETGKLLFKGWIVLMLVGYFVLFLVLALVAFLASIAIKSSGSGDRDDRGGGLGGLFLTGRLFETIINIWFYSEIFKDPRQRGWEADERARKRRERRPLHKAVFSFVFGEGDPNADWDGIERKAVVAWLQANRGVITMPEFRALTGLSPLAAEERINLYLRDFKGSPEVSENGTIWFAFPDLLRRADKADASFGGSAPMKRVAPFSANKPKANFWYGAINLVNLAFGSYFLAGALAAHPLLPVIYGGRYATRLVTTGGWDGFYLLVHQLLGKMAGLDPQSIQLGLGFGLGLVPVSFAVLFFGIPAIRRLRLQAQNEAVKVENLRRLTYRAVLDRPEGLSTSAIVPSVAEATPSDPRAVEKVLSELAAAEGGEPKVEGTEQVWSWPGISRAKEDAAKVRASIKPGDYALGATVFDSHE